MEALRTNAPGPQPDLELLRVGYTIVSILFGVLLLLWLSTIALRGVNNDPDPVRTTMDVSSIALFFLGTLIGRSARYRRIYGRRFAERHRMSRLERIRTRAALSVAVVGLLVLYFVAPILIGPVLWPGRGWVDNAIAADPAIRLAASAGFATVMLYGWTDRPSRSHAVSA
jgi:uncharacterized membrane protein YkvA (DUF1232 family)